MAVPTQSQQQRKTSKPLNDCIIRSLCHISDIRMKDETQTKMLVAL